MRLTFISNVLNSDIGYHVDDTRLVSSNKKILEGRTKHVKNVQISGFKNMLGQAPWNFLELEKRALSQITGQLV